MIKKKKIYLCQIQRNYHILAFNEKPHIAGFIFISIIYSFILFKASPRNQNL